MKKIKTKSKKATKEILPDLPQNIFSVGERVYEDKNIYIHQKVYRQIHRFSANKTENEHGGILVGRVVNELGKENTIIEGFIEAKYNTATPTTLTFTHETWEHFHSEIDKKFKGKKIVGWIHTHPNFGIFLSENDKFIQQNFFTDTNQVAYVVDPIQQEEGFFYWIDEKLERCPGFYLFDKNGVKLQQNVWTAEEDEADHVVVKTKSHPWLTAILILVLLANLIVSFMQAKKIEELERQVEDHHLVIQYGVLGGATPIPYVANDIRQQLANQQKALEEAQKRAEEQKEAAEQPDGEQPPAEQPDGEQPSAEQPDGAQPEATPATEE